MQAVPSLIGAGTAVAAASTGLVFGQASESNDPCPCPSKRKPNALFDSSRSPFSSSRPATGIAANVAPLAVDYRPRTSFHPLPEPLPSPLSPRSTDPLRSDDNHGNQIRRITPPESASSRQHSFIRPSEHANPSTADIARDSISSNGSWIRRLSLRPLSHHGSMRSSTGPESPSLVFPQGSGVPILAYTGSTTSQLPPNKLVKRPSSRRNSRAGDVGAGRGARSQMPTFRRPATSHQRSATLHIGQQADICDSPHTPKSPEPKSRPRAFSTFSVRINTPRADARPEVSAWASFFHLRVASADGGRSDSTSGILPPKGRVQSLSQHAASPRAYLVKPAALSGVSIAPQQPSAAARQISSSDVDSTVAQHTPPRRSKRSMSLALGSASDWMSRAGSLRRLKQDTPEGGEGRRHDSVPSAMTSTTQGPADLDPESAAKGVFAPREPHHLQPAPEPAATDRPRARKRDSSSPSPRTSYLPAFDVGGPVLDQPTAPGPDMAPAVLLPSPQISSALARSRGVSGEFSSTVTGSDLESRGFTSGDDDDTDFRSDVMFDSLRTTGSSRCRNVETPLGSMFDDSPSSTSGNMTAKRLSIQDMLGPSWEHGSRISEEDESALTPVRRNGVDHQDMSSDVGRRNADEPLASKGEPPKLSLAAKDKDHDRPSWDDDDDDEDWARDEEFELSNRLSPPTSSLNSRRTSLHVRHALGSISGNGSNEYRYGHAAAGERPRSNLFDWTEPSAHDKLDMEGNWPRPKTVHGKQAPDLRGGRATNRKGHGAAHVRSQSVPVIPEQLGGSKPAPKFGTWGLSTKPVSEDWDADFDFDEGEGMASQPGGKDSATSFTMVVPASIQATQPTVRAHSGQIRELSLLVNDLKRLCRHGKDLGVLDGSSSSKWKEAQNIIELASPDEDEDEEGRGAMDMADIPESVQDPHAHATDEPFIDEGFEASPFDRLREDLYSIPEPEMTKNTVVRERQAIRRRSVFSPDDDIFGGAWPLKYENSPTAKRRSLEQSANPINLSRKSALVSTVIEAMQQQRSTSTTARSRSPAKPSQPKLFFDTNSLQELVKKAGQLRDSLSDVVRRAELLTQSPAGTPRKERSSRLGDSSPAFTRVFAEQALSPPPQRLPDAHNTSAVLISRASVDSPRLQVMTVS